MTFAQALNWEAYIEQASGWDDEEYEAQMTSAEVAQAQADWDAQHPADDYGLEARI